MPNRGNSTNSTDTTITNISSTTNTDISDILSNWSDTIYVNATHVSNLQDYVNIATGDFYINYTHSVFEIDEIEKEIKLSDLLRELNE